MATGKIQIFQEIFRLTFINLVTRPPNTLFSASVRVGSDGDIDIFDAALFPSFKFSLGLSEDFAILLL
jgi:hypothetical protein